VEEVHNTVEQLNLEDKLGRNVFKIDKDEAHIIIDHEICRQRCTLRPCLNACPAHLYTYNEERDEIFVDYEGCLECGTCLIVCEDEALTWHYPRAGFGVQYRFG
jgi:ferredoxin like protein